MFERWRRIRLVVVVRGGVVSRRRYTSVFCNHSSVHVCRKSRIGSCAGACDLDASFSRQEGLKDRTQLDIPSDPTFLVMFPGSRVMKAGTVMPAVDGVTIGMTPENCMAYCFNHPRNYKFFGEGNTSLPGRPRDREGETAAGTKTLTGLTVSTSITTDAHSKEPHHYRSPPIKPKKRQRTIHAPPSKQ